MNNTLARIETELTAFLYTLDGGGGFVDTGHGTVRWSAHHPTQGPAARALGQAIEAIGAARRYLGEVDDD